MCFDPRRSVRRRHFVAVVLDTAGERQRLDGVNSSRLPQRNELKVGHGELTCERDSRVDMKVGHQMADTNASSADRL